VIVGVIKIAFMQSALNLLWRPSLAQQLGDDEKGGGAKLELARTSWLTSSLDGLTPGDCRIVSDGCGSMTTNLAPDRTGYAPQQRSNLAYVGLLGCYLNDAGAFFYVKLVVVGCHGDTLSGCCTWFMRPPRAKNTI